jgi:hypothetical protein
MLLHVTRQPSGYLPWEDVIRGTPVDQLLSPDERQLIPQKQPCPELNCRTRSRSSRRLQLSRVSTRRDFRSLAHAHLDRSSGHNVFPFPVTFRVIPISSFALLAMADPSQFSITLPVAASSVVPSVSGLR